MEGLKLKRTFRHYVRRKRVDSNTQLLFHTLWDEIDEGFWQQPLAISNAELCRVCGVDEKTLISHRNKLKQHGFLDFTTGRRGSPTEYTLHPPIPVSSSASDGVSSECSSETSGESSCKSSGESSSENAYKIHIPKTYNPYPLPMQKSEQYDSRGYSGSRYQPKPRRDVNEGTCRSERDVGAMEAMLDAEWLDTSTLDMDASYDDGGGGTFTLRDLDPAYFEEC